jgi:lysophospholipase L1-like esterase
MSVVVLCQEANDPLYRKNPHYEHQLQLHAIYRTKQTDVVMLGNSITFGVNWNELMGRNGIVNRGIPSDVLEGFSHRLSDIIQLHPAVVCILGGINDLYEDIHVDTVFLRYRALVDTLRKHDIVPVIQSTLYVSPRWKRHEKKNREVAQLNSLLRRYADLEHLEFLDLNAVLSKDGMLKDEVTTDGVHLTASGYACWRDALEPVLKKYAK